MATFKAVVLKHQKRKDGKYPVSIRIGKDGKSVYVKTEYYVDERGINKKTFEIKDSFVIERTNNMIRSYERSLLEFDHETLKCMSCEELKKHLQNSKKTIDFFEECEEFLKTKSSGTAECYRTAIRNAKIVNGVDKMPVVLFNSSFIERFAREMNNSNRYINGQIVLLGSIFKWICNKYNSEFSSVIKHNPFFNYKPLVNNLPLRERNISNKDFVSCMEELKHIKRFVYDICVISFLLCGMNSADILELKKSDYKDGRIFYKRKKTRTRRADEAFMSVRVEPELIPFLEKYKGDGDSLFNFKNSERNLSLNATYHTSKIKTCYFCFYTVRHKWANIARMDCGISDGDIDFCLCHVGDSKMADIYTGKTFDIVDRCNRKVIDKYLQILKKRGVTLL